MLTFRRLSEDFSVEYIHKKAIHKKFDIMIQRMIKRKVYTRAVTGIICPAHCFQKPEF